MPTWALCILICTTPILLIISNRLVYMLFKKMAPISAYSQILGVSARSNKMIGIPYKKQHFYPFFLCIDLYHSNTLDYFKHVSLHAI